MSCKYCVHCSMNIHYTMHSAAIREYYCSLGNDFMFNYVHGSCNYFRKEKVTMNTSLIKKVIFNNPATIVLWNDGTKTVVKCCSCELFDPEKGLAMAFAKKMLGNKNDYYKELKSFIPKDSEEEPIRSDLYPYTLNEEINRKLKEIKTGVDNITNYLKPKGEKRK